jgi:hypothetical protein
MARAPPGEEGQAFAALRRPSGFCAAKRPCSAGAAGCVGALVRRRSGLVPLPASRRARAERLRRGRPGCLVRASLKRPRALGVGQGWKPAPGAEAWRRAQGLGGERRRQGSCSACPGFSRWALGRAGGGANARPAILAGGHGALGAPGGRRRGPQLGAPGGLRRRAGRHPLPPAESEARPQHCRGRRAAGGEAGLVEAAGTPGRAPVPGAARLVCRGRRRRGLRAGGDWGRPSSAWGAVQAAPSPGG